jgi:hypothetical protein
MSVLVRVRPMSTRRRCRDSVDVSSGEALGEAKCVMPRTRPCAEEVGELKAEHEKGTFHTPERAEKAAAKILGA